MKQRKIILSILSYLISITFFAVLLGHSISSMIHKEPDTVVDAENNETYNVIDGKIIQITTIGAMHDYGESTNRAPWFNDENIDITKITSITIDPTVTAVGQYSFNGLPNLKSVILNPGLTKIGIGAFKGCPNLVDINFTKDISEIGSYAFEGCSSLNSIIIRNGINTIGDAAFKNCTGLKELVISTQLSSVSASLCEGCTNLEYLILESNITNYGTKAFYNCPSLKQVLLTTDNLSSNSITVGTDAFNFIATSAENKRQGTTGEFFLKSSNVTVDPNNSNIKYSTFFTNLGFGYSGTGDGLGFWTYETLNEFANNANAWWVVTSNSLVIGGHGNMAENNSFTYNNGVVTPWATKYGADPSILSAVRIIYVGDEILNIPDYAFCYGTNQDLHNATTLVIGEKVETIGNCSFSNTHISSITFPQSITTIGNNTFQDAQTLEYAFLRETGNITFGTDPFDKDSNTLNRKFYFKSTEISSSLTGLISTYDSMQQMVVSLESRTVEPGVYYEAQTIKLTFTKGATFYYTLDNTQATKADNLYDSSTGIVLSTEPGTITEYNIHLVGYKDNWQPYGPSFLGQYTINIKLRVAIPDADTTNFVYTGAAQTYNLVENPNIYTISGNEKTTVADSGFVTVELNDKDHYEWDYSDQSRHDSGDLSYEFIIHKAIYGTGNFYFPTEGYEYTGQEITFKIVQDDGQLPPGLTIDHYENNTGTQLGAYNNVTCYFSGDFANYEQVGPIITTVNIHEKVLPAPTITQQYVYNGQEQTFDIEILKDYAGNDLYTVEGNKGTNADTYTVTLTLKDTSHYKWEGSELGDAYKVKQIQVTINKADYILGVYSFDNQEMTYTGEDLTPVLNIDSSILEQYGLTPVITTTSESHKDVGIYTFTLTFNGTNNNYNDIPFKQCTLKINKKAIEEPRADTTDYTYTGSPITYQIPASPYYTVSGHVQTMPSQGAGYTVTVTLNDTNNTYWSNHVDKTSITYAFIIKLGQYDLSNWSFEDTYVTYDGLPHKLEAVGTLPDGLTITYHNTDTYTEISPVGHEYTISFHSSDNLFVTPEDMTRTMYIVPRKVEKPAKDTTEYVYTGDSIKYKLDETSNYTVEYNTAVFAGTSSVKITLKDGHSAWDDGSPFGNTDPLYYPFVINRADYDLSSLKFNDKTVEYDGTPKSIIAENIPSSIQDKSIQYIGNGNVNVGSYLITIKFLKENWNPNYNYIDDLHATLTIVSKMISKPLPDTRTYVYNGSKHTYTIAQSDYYKVNNNVYTDAGTYVVKISLNNPAGYMNYAWDDGTFDDLKYNFVIEKGTIDLTGIITFEDETVPFSGEYYHPSISGILPTGVTVTYDTKGYVKSGTYTIQALFHADSNNYNPIDPMSCKLTILTPKNDIKSENDTVELVAGEGYGFVAGASILANETSYKMSDFVSKLENDDKIEFVYRIELSDAQGNIVKELAFEAPILLRFKLPEKALELKNLKIIHYHSATNVSVITEGTEPAVGKYVIQDGYLITYIEGLSSFAFVTPYVNPISTCIVHYFLIAILVAAIGFDVYWFIIKKNKNFFDPIVLSVFAIHLLLTFILTIIGKCSLCIIFGLINLLPIIAICSLAIIKKVKERQNELEHKQELVGKSRIQLDVDEIKAIEEMSQEVEEDYVFHMKKAKSISAGKEEDQSDYVVHKVKKKDSPESDELTAQQIEEKKQIEYQLNKLKDMIEESKPRPEYPEDEAKEEQKAEDSKPEEKDEDQKVD